MLCLVDCPGADGPSPGTTRTVHPYGCDGVDALGGRGQGWAGTATGQRALCRRTGHRTAWRVKRQAIRRCSNRTRTSSVVGLRDPSRPAACGPHDRSWQWVGWLRCRGRSRVRAGFHHEDTGGTGHDEPRHQSLVDARHAVKVLPASSRAEAIRACSNLLVSGRRGSTDSVRAAVRPRLKAEDQ